MTTTAVRSVRFSDDPPKVTTQQTISTDNNDGFCSNEKLSSAISISLPQLYDDALYSPYDIYTASSIGDITVVKNQLEMGFDANRLNGSGWSSLMYASYLGHENVGRLLLENGANVDLCNHNGQTALMLAATCGNFSVVKLLLQKGAMIDKQDNIGDTALTYATSCSQTNIVEILLDSNANANLSNKFGMTPTLTACFIGHELTLLALLKNDGDPKIRNHKGEDGEALAIDNPKAIAILKDPPASKRKQNSMMKVEIDSLNDLLRKLKLEKYSELFHRENIDLNLFLQLNDADLVDIGIKTFGPRKKMLSVIQHYRTNGTFLLYAEEKKAISGSKESEQKRHEICSQQVMNELIECQQQLSQCQNELKKSRKTLDEYRIALDTIAEGCRQSRKIAYAMIEEIRQQKANGRSESKEMNMEKVLLTIIKNIDIILMKMIELPPNI